MVRQVVVLHKDCMCCCRLQLLEFLFQKADIRVVVNTKDTDSNHDLLAINTVCVTDFNK